MILSDLPIGAIVEHPDLKYLGGTIVFQIVSKNHNSKDSGYPKGGIVLQTRDLIAMREMDHDEPQNSAPMPNKWAKTNYLISNLDQWLNSEKKDWFFKVHEADTAPPWSTSDSGFLSYFPESLRSELMDASIQNLQIDDTGIQRVTGKRKVFIPSAKELGLENEGVKEEGHPFEFYTSDSSRKKTSSDELGSGDLYWWTRTQMGSSGEYMMMINTSGGYDYGYNPRTEWGGVSPAIILPENLEIVIANGKNIIKTYTNYKGVYVKVNNNWKKVKEVYV